MRTAIVDDNPIDRLNLRTLLEHSCEVDILGEAGSLVEGRSLIESARPDVVFLDVRLGRETGFHLLESLNQKPRVIFTTLHREYAFPAFEVEALDFLHKPVTLERLQRSLRRMTASAAASEVAPVLDPTDLLVFRQGNERRVIEAGRIVAIVGDRDYTRVLTAPDMECLDERRMRDWQKLLPPKMFQLLDRSTILNLRQIASYRQTSEGGIVVLRNYPSPLRIGVTAFRRLEGILHARSAV